MEAERFHVEASHFVLLAQQRTAVIKFVVSYEIHESHRCYIDTTYSNSIRDNFENSLDLSLGQSLLIEVSYFLT